jgi:hypothetical protein
MLSQYHFTCPRRRLLLACLVTVLVAGTARAQDQTLLASDLATHTSGASLRPVTEEDSSSSATAAPSTDSSASASTPPPSGADPAPSAPMPPPGVTSAPEVAANTATTPPLPTATTDPASDSPSQNVTINLINLMVKKNLISRDDADSLIRQAQQEADLARAQAANAQATADRALTAQQAQAAPAPAPAQTTSDDEVRVTYVPDVVKKQITDQVTQNVMEQTREEHMADTIAARQVPDWVKRFHVTGDVRVRYEDDMYPSGNAIGNFTNFNAINTSASGFNANSPAPFLPQYNADQDRNRFRLRARIGAGIDLGDNFTAGMRIGTGSDDNPVTENQTLGGANSGQGSIVASFATITVASRRSTTSA